MDKYYVDKNRQLEGEHEVHKEGCSWMPSDENRIYLGEFYMCRLAVEEAKKHYFMVDGCYACCRECYTR